MGSTIRPQDAPVAGAVDPGASITSLAVLVKNARMTRMLNTDTALGRISAQYWS